MSKNHFFYGKCQDSYSLEFGEINTFFCIQTDVTNLFELHKIIREGDKPLRATIVQEMIFFKRDWITKDCYKKTKTFEYEVKNMISEFGELNFITYPHNRPKEIQECVFLEKLKTAFNPETELTKTTTHKRCNNSQKFIKLMTE